MPFIYKICPESLWENALRIGRFEGSDVDVADGYIHFSTGGQVKETARKHFSHQDALVILAIDPALLGNSLKWEASRGGDLFPHLYAPLPTSAVLAVAALPWHADGRHIFPVGAGFEEIAG